MGIAEEHFKGFMPRYPHYLRFFQVGSLKKPTDSLVPQIMKVKILESQVRFLPGAPRKRKKIRPASC
jgi:hypothetical protein